MSRPKSTSPTERQLDVLFYLRKGLCDKNIARALGITHHTVRNHTHELYRYFGIAGPQRLKRRALENRTLK